ncbi:MAG: RluA family pseudouridine synthase [Candidatus Ancaeobacter aquaticus]|nr:RluA family pseudouridine synthase [Candidatus Ancaeobacter aquaticus]
MKKKIDIVFEDDFIVVANKPSGLLVVPTPKGEKETLTNFLNEQKSRARTQTKLYPCHRLDRDTSGIIVYAKGKTVRDAMMDVFKERRITKKYIAFINGTPKKDRATVDYRIEGKESITRYYIVHKASDFSVVEAEPVTGRTNQIRIHFKMIGYPILGERKFAFARDYHVRFKRTALHAYRISFQHPMTKKYVTFTQPLPSDMKQFLLQRKIIVPF